MTTITLLPVPIHTQDSINHYSEENRPLIALHQNTLILKEFLESLITTNLLTQNNTWLKAQRYIFTTVSSTAGELTLHLDLSNNFVCNLGEDTLLVPPINPVAGQRGSIQINQGSASIYTFQTDAFWKFPGGIPSAIATATTNAVDMIGYTIDPTGTYASCFLYNDIK